MKISWSSKVNQKVRRSGTSWEETEGFVEDTTRSGKAKRRIATTQAVEKYNVSFLFTVDEYKEFTLWYNNDCRRGFNSFDFPQIDGFGKTLVEYRFAKGGAPKYSNPSGDMIQATMIWEKVK